MKKFLGLLALIVAACGLMSAAAQAAGIEWLSDGAPIPAGKVEPVATKGTLTLTLRAPTGKPIGTIKCKVVDKENIQNGPNGGTDEMVALAFRGCKARPTPCPAGTVTEVRALGLPWRSALIPGPPVRDEFSGVTIEVACSKAVFAIYGGTLAPEVGASVLVFGPGSGSLSGGLLEVAGTDKLKGPPKDTRITAS